MRIKQILVVPAWGGYYNDDLMAIEAGAAKDGLFYLGPPVTPGFDKIREPAEAASVVLVLDNGAVTVGDALSVAYSGAGGRRIRFTRDRQAPLLRHFASVLEGWEIGDWREMCGRVEALPSPGNDFHRSAAEYGLSQALLQAAALREHCTAAAVVARACDRQPAVRMVPIYVQSGDDRHVAVDKAIARRAEVLPHGLINTVDLIGRNGETLIAYVEWIVERIRRFAPGDYRPELHFDTYGLLGHVFSNDPAVIARYVASLAEAASPHPLCLETPVLLHDRDAQIDSFAAIRRELKRLGSSANLIVDEWANTAGDIEAFVAAEAADMVNVKSPDLGSLTRTVQAIRQCWEGGVRPILGGSCTDTDVSARAIANVALGAGPAWVLARPGMGIDEGFQIVHNEMRRVLALLHS